MTQHVVIDFLHLLATVMWIGGMLFIPLVFMPAVATAEPSTRGPIMGVMSKRFTIVAWSSMFLLIITGLIKTPASLLFSTASSYETWLTVKQSSVVVMVLVGAVITFFFAPRMRSLAPKPGECPSPDFLSAQKSLLLASKVNTVLGLLVLFCLVMMRNSF